MPRLFFIFNLFHFGRKDFYLYFLPTLSSDFSEGFGRLAAAYGVGELSTLNLQPTSTAIGA
jgi:hypothetical protein